MTTWDIGDQVPTGITVSNKVGASIDTDGVVRCLVTDPAGVVWDTNGGPNALTLSHDGTGLYSTLFPAVLSGLHQVAWTNTGTYAAAFPDVFWVGPTGGMLVSIGEALEVLNLSGTPNPATYSERLRSYVLGVTCVVESIVGAILSVTCDEYYDGGSELIMLDHAPVQSVTSVVEAGGGAYIRTLTLQAPDSGTQNAYGYSVDLKSGTLIRRTTGRATPFLPGRRNVHVVYVAGNPTVGANVREGTLELIRINWQPVQGGNRPGYDRPGGEDINVDGAWRMGFFIPNRVMEMLAPSARGWGIA